MRGMTLGSVLLVTLLATPLAAQSPAVKISSVSWLQGCWSLVSPQRVIEEQWMAPRGRNMVGMGRTLRGDSLMEFEVVVIKEGDAGTLLYEAHPSGQPPATFTASTVSDTAVLFENPAHDFPQKVGYRRIGRDSLVGYIEGSIGGRRRHIAFPYARARCASEATTAPAEESEEPTRPLTQARRDAMLRDLESHRAAWRARHITDYRLQVAVGCFCPWPSNPMILDVRRGAIQQLLDTLGKAAGKPREPWSRYSVEALFDAAAQSIQSADVITVRYDSCYDFPTEISGVGRAGLPDNWFWVKASRLTALR